ncbi:MAG: hypothetical protein WKG07_38185 [Hymenobacter sp.]
MEDEYLNLLRLFHAEGVEYVIVGGYAVIAHGFPRTTGDLDILVRPTPANAQRLLRALEAVRLMENVSLKPPISPSRQISCPFIPTACGLI